jgi:uncharacterized protein YutE (UPF0331/DUF86 family)
LIAPSWPPNATRSCITWGGCARAPLDVSMLEADEDQRNIVLMDLQQAVQAVIDLATHVCSHEGLGLPQGPASAFALLASHG